MTTVIFIYTFFSDLRPSELSFEYQMAGFFNWWWNTVLRRPFYWFHLVRLFSLRRPLVHGLFVSWGTTGWQLVINSLPNIHVTIDCLTVLPLVLGVVTRQRPQINGSVVLVTRTDPRPAVRPAEGPNSFHWKNVKLEVLSCCTKFHEPHVVSEYVHF